MKGDRLGGMYCQGLLLNWKLETGRTYREMGSMLGISAAHVHRAVFNKRRLTKRKIEKAERVIELDRLIRTNPADRLLLEYELDQLIGAKCKLN